MRSLNRSVCQNASYEIEKVIISMFMAIFKRLFKKKPKVQTGIPREKFIQLINLGYDKFKSKEEIQEFVEEGKFKSPIRNWCFFYYFRTIIFPEQLCELVEEEDLELVTALVQWDFEDEMEDEDDEHGMFDFFCLKFRCQNQESTNREIFKTWCEIFWSWSKLVLIFSFFWSWTSRFWSLDPCVRFQIHVDDEIRHENS